MKLNKGGMHIAKKNKVRINEDITAEKVRLISENGEQKGILTIEDALESAQESGFDLIEISPNSNPPVCKLLDYGKVKYEQKKKAIFMCPYAENKNL